VLRNLGITTDAVVQAARALLARRTP
jgi:hypothetical protein